jgi:Mitochondrial resolvase Ydc2 / RNA splicing MRS1
MGIRNLALCSLSIPPDREIPPVPRIDAWSRVTVSAKSTEGGETFEPSEYAKKAYELMRKSLEMYRPHTILIERQRYRSGGAAAVQEWTVRVNMLESMFHAVLRTLSETRSSISTPALSTHSPSTPSLDSSSLPEFEVHSVSPKKITQLWVQEEGRLTARETKVKKIAVAKKIVDGEEVKVEFVGQAREVAEKFNVRGEGKADDLADSMLQCLGWWRWHVHREEMVREILAWEEVVKKVKEKKVKEKKGKEKTKKGEEGAETKTRRRKSKKEAEMENPAVDDSTTPHPETKIASPAEEIIVRLPLRKTKTSALQKSSKSRTKKEILELHA